VAAFFGLSASLKENYASSREGKGQKKEKFGDNTLTSQVTQRYQGRNP
jgi:hypothetical protein